MDTENNIQAGKTETENQVLNTGDIKAYIQEMREKQSLVKGMIGGLVAAVVGAGLWALITVETEYQIGWMAVGVGFLVGYGVRIMGKGVDAIFGVIGAVLALLGCIGGNLLTVLYFACCKHGLPVASLDSALLMKFMVKSFEPMDIVFYALAIYEGFKFSVVRLEEE